MSHVVDTRSVLAVDPRSDPRWAQLAAGPKGSLFTSPPWIAAVCDTYGFTPQARLAVDGRGRAVGGFAWVEIDDIRGRRVSSLPFCDWADPLVDDAASWEAVSADAFAAGAGLGMRCRLPSPAIDDARLERSGEAAWHGTALDVALEQVQARLSASARRNIRLAARTGVTVEVSADLDAVRAFHRLHVALRKAKYRLLAQPVELFERIHSGFDAGDVVTVTARVDGAPVAGAVYVVWGTTMYYKFGASLAAFLHHHPNEAVHWAAVQHAVGRGATMLDWGLSDLDQPGLVAYKRKWATVEGRVTFLRAPAAVPGGGAAAGRLLGDLTTLLTDASVPDEVTARAGALLYRHFC